ncbi:hypothetical protein HYALB_00002653 [Hymenoscyphus albidus]|uniref:Rhodopsin domain-containing protein n=1 Tax=Hymenoscyphus albidus TaxID=595503 RepID=A0A9N9LRB8_9HELO|nr:hypothetical protein HYALB_00002653 [Hymenoscyphus albidus]
MVLSSSKGLGQHWESSSASDQVLLMKTLYIAGLLSIPTLVITKISVIIFMQGLGPASIHKRIGAAFSAFLILWGLGSEFAVAFQCRVPQPWNVVDHGCINM